MPWLVEWVGRENISPSSSRVLLDLPVSSPVPHPMSYYARLPQSGASLVHFSLWIISVSPGEGERREERGESWGCLCQHSINLCFQPHAIPPLSTVPHSWALLGLWEPWIRLASCGYISWKALRSYNFLLLWLVYLLFHIAGSNHRNLLISKATFLFLILFLVLGDKFQQEKKAKILLFCHLKTASFSYMLLCLQQPSKVLGT